MEFAPAVIDGDFSQEEDVDGEPEACDVGGCEEGGEAGAEDGFGFGRAEARLVVGEIGEAVGVVDEDALGVGGGVALTDLGLGDVDGVSIGVAGHYARVLAPLTASFLSGDEGGGLGGEEGYGGGYLF